MSLTASFIKPSFDSTTAVQIRKADGITPIINIDTTNLNVGIATTNPAYRLDSNGDINTSTVYRIGGETILKLNTAESLFVGAGAGLNDETGWRNTVIGNGAGYFNTTGSGNAAGGNSGTITSSIAIGYFATVTANNQLVVGSAYPYGGQIIDSYWGSGVTKVNPSAFTFNATGGEGTDNAGADLKIAGGKGTGAASGGKIIFQTAPAGPSGVTPNALVDRMTITADGNVAIGAQIPTALLDVNGTTGYNQLRIRTAYTPIGTSDANGNTGDIAWDDDYVYVKTSMGWKRAALSTW